MAFPLIEDRERGQTLLDQAPGGFLDSLEASSQQAIDRTMVSSIGDVYAMGALGRVEGQRELSVAELTARHPGVNWSGPQKENVAEYIAKEHERRGQLERRINMADGAAGQGIANFAASMFIGAPEMIIGGYGVGAAMKGAGLLQGANYASRMGFGFVENAASSVPVELANMYRDRQMEMDISLSSSVANVAVGGLVGAGIEGLRFKFGKKAEAARVKLGEDLDRIRALAPEEQVKVSEIAAQQLAEGRRPMVGKIVDMIVRQKEGIGPKPANDLSGRSVNKFIDHGSNEDIAGTFFNGTVARVEDQRLHGPTNSPYGPVQSGTTDAMFENVKSVNAKGFIHQFDVAGKFAPLDAALPAPVKAMVEKVLADNPKLLKDLLENSETSLREIYDNLPPEKAAELTAELKYAGYKGVHGIEGLPGNERNAVSVFADSAEETIRPHGALESDSRFVGQPSPEEWSGMLQEYHAAENELFQSAERDRLAVENAKHVEERGKVELREAAEEDIAVSDKMLKQADEGGFLTEGEKAIIAEIDGKGEVVEGQMSLPDKEKLGKNILDGMAKCVVEH